MARVGVSFTWSMDRDAMKEIPVLDETGKIVANLGILELWRLADLEWGRNCPA